MRRYFALPNTWFEEGTEVELVADCYPHEFGIFCGWHDNGIDEESCPFDEFLIVDEDACESS